MLKKFIHFALGLILSLNYYQSAAQTVSSYIVVDQFGYTSAATKVAIIRDPQIGFDATESFSPGTTYALINTATNTPVFTAAPTLWSAGNTDPSSGDKVWWFDFTSVETPGTYYVKDVSKNERSVTFIIADNVYKDVLKASMRMFFYQRAGFEKAEQYAGVGWKDGASHLGTNQDIAARLYLSKSNSSTAKDLRGGWYNGGDYNRYTSWTANCIINLLTAYTENPSVFTDDYNIPESGNGTPDIIDEAKWGLDHLLRMQEATGNGSCLSILGVSQSSPPSSASGASYYGTASTNATLKCAAAFALAAKVYKQVDPIKYASYVTTLQTQATAAWDWAVANPNVKFFNNDDSNQPGSGGLGGDQQETDDLGRKTSKLGAALYLYDLTGQAKYLTYFESNYTELPLIAMSSYINQYYFEPQSILMFYLTLSGTNNTIVADIKTRTVTAMKKSGDFASALINETDPYRAFIKDYNKQGTNSYKSNYGNFYWKVQKLALDNSSNNELYLKTSEEYLHYIHGVNPLGLVYITNMSGLGAEKSITQIYHTWFGNGSSKWDQVGVSTYGPAPGFLSGGPNDTYDWDINCTSASPNSGCGSAAPAPPKGQPSQKSYKDFNTSWPLNSWQVSEPTLAYQTAYIRLLSKFVSNSTVATGILSSQATPSLNVKPNPTQDQLTIEFPAAVSTSDEIQVDVYNVVGNIVLSKKIQNSSNISIGALENGIYILKVSQEGLVYTQRVVKIQ